MSENPYNLVFRFLLELAGLVTLGYWGWTQHTGLARWLLAVGAPLLAALLWGTFRVPDDPGKAPVPISGGLRLLLEAAFFGAGVWALYASGRTGWGAAFGLLVLVHYLISYDRVIKLLRS